MESTWLKTLLDNISDFDILMSSSNMKPEILQRYCENFDGILKLLKPVLEDVSALASDGQQGKEFQELDAAINEARELVGSWHHMMSKIYFVLEMESAVRKLKTSAIERLRVLQSITDNSALDIEDCIEKIQLMQFDLISDVIKEAVKDIMEKKEPRTECQKKIADSLSLLTNQELLMEAVALDKTNTKVVRGEKHGDILEVDHMMALITYMHDCYVRIKQVQSINGVPIPADFCCPLSLELMSDPVIVASGQTYERAFIRKWLDQGLTVCPKTRQTLGHTNLIPNYTVKALIANWCESNDIKLPDPVKSADLNLPSTFLSNSSVSSGDINSSLHGLPSRLSYLRSPESNRVVMNSQWDKISSNGAQGTYLHDKPTSTHLSPSVDEALQINGSDVDIARISLGRRLESRKQGNSEERHDGIISGQSQENVSRASLIGDQMQGHNRSNSASTSVIGNEYVQSASDGNLVSRVSSDLTHYSSDGSGELARGIPDSSSPQREPDFTTRLNDARLRPQPPWRRTSDRFGPRVISSSIESRPDLSAVENQVRKLIEDLKSGITEEQRTATAELRLLAKHNMENRIVIANCGAINLLVSLLHSTDLKTQENAVTALLNLSINDNNKTAIANAEAIDPLIHVLETGSPEAKENSAATLFSLSVIEENKVRIGRSGAINPLVELLGNGTPRGKKDAATALFNLSIFHENKARIVQAGAVRYLVELMDPAAGMVDKAVAVLANLATIPEGRTAIGQEGGIPVLVEVVELGSARGKENSAAALLQLCTNSNRFCSQVLQEGAVPPLVALSQSGTPRAREKAQALLSYFRNQRHGNARP